MNYIEIFLHSACHLFFLRTAVTVIILWICDVSNKTLEVTQWSGLLLNMGKEYEEHKEAEYKKNAALEKRDSSGFCLHIYVK